MIGVGFVIHFADHQCANIAWPDTVADHVPLAHLGNRGIVDITNKMPRPAVTMESRSIETSSGQQAEQQPEVDTNAVNEGAIAANSVPGSVQTTASESADTVASGDAAVPEANDAAQPSAAQQADGQAAQPAS